MGCFRSDNEASSTHGGCFKATTMILCSLAVCSSEAAFHARSRFSSRIVPIADTNAVTFGGFAYGRPSLHIPPRLYMAEEDDEVAEEPDKSEGKSPEIKKPAPPEDLPTIPSGYIEDMKEKELKIRMYEKEIEMVRQLLLEKQEELDEEKSSWTDEKTSLLDKIKEFTKLLSSRDEEVASREEKEEEYFRRQEALTLEINELKEQLQNKKQAYDLEVKTVKELKKELAETQDALEYDQMNFKEEKASLMDAVFSEQRSLKSLEEKLKQKEESFNRTKQELIEKVKQEEAKLSKAKTEWQETEARLQDEQQILMDKLKEQEERLEEEKRGMMKERDGFDEVRLDFQNKLKEQESKVEETKDVLKKEQGRFEEAKLELELTIKQEQDKISNLQEQLVKEQENFSTEKARLEMRIREEERRLAEVQSELAQERAEKLEEIAGLQKDLAEQARVGRLKKRQMNERYEAIRTELTEKWEAAKRNARKEEQRITKRYENKLEVIRSRVQELEGDLEKSNKSNDDLQLALANMTQEKENVIKDARAMEARYQGILSEQKSQINNLQYNVAGLKTVIEEKDAVIDRYETSFRALARLSFKVTGNKLKSTGGRLKRLVQNSPPKELDE